MQNKNTILVLASLCAMNITGIMQGAAVAEALPRPAVDAAHLAVKNAHEKHMRQGVMLLVKFGINNHNEFLAKITESIGAEINRAYNTSTGQYIFTQWSVDPLTEASRKTILENLCVMLGKKGYFEDSRFPTSRENFQLCCWKEFYFTGDPCHYTSLPILYFDLLKNDQNFNDYITKSIRKKEDAQFDAFFSPSK
jgi:hypothetical protein